MGRLGKLEKAFLDYLWSAGYRTKFFKAQHQIREWKSNGKVGPLRVALYDDAYDGYNEWITATRTKPMKTKPMKTKSKKAQAMKTKPMKTKG